MTKTQQKETAVSLTSAPKAQKPETLPIMTYPAAWGEMHGKKAEKALPTLLVPFKVIKNPMGYMFWTRELGGSVFFRQTDTPHYDTLRAAQPIFMDALKDVNTCQKCKSNQAVRCIWCFGEESAKSYKEGMAQGRKDAFKQADLWANHLCNKEGCRAYMMEQIKEAQKEGTKA